MVKRGGAFAKTHMSMCETCTLHVETTWDSWGSDPGTPDRSMRGEKGEEQGLGGAGGVILGSDL